jgi:hypothetical protein
MLRKKKIGRAKNEVHICYLILGRWTNGVFNINFVTVEVTSQLISVWHSKWNYVHNEHSQSN